MARAKESGQSLIEFALVLPIFICLVLLVADVGGIFWRFNATTELAAIVTRDASIHGPRYALATAAILNNKFGMHSGFKVAYDAKKENVTTIVTTPNRAIFFGKGMPITVQKTAHVEIPH